MSSHSDRLALALNGQRNVFKAFLVARVGSEADADDILQNGLSKALQRGHELQYDTKLTAWFYRLLRNAIIDFYRVRDASRRRDDVLGTTMDALGEDIAKAPPGWSAQLCACLAGVAATLKPKHAELIRRVDLEDESVQSAAKAQALPPTMPASRSTAPAAISAKNFRPSAAHAPTARAWIASAKR